MPDDQKPSLSFTQQGAAKKDRNALTRARKHGISDREIINRLADAHSNPDSAEAVMEAAGVLAHTKCNMNKLSPLHDAVTSIIEERKAEGRTTLHTGSSATQPA